MIISGTKFVKQFLEIAQPLPVYYANSQELRKDLQFVTFEYFGSTNLKKGIGNQIISEDATYLVTVQTDTAKANVIYSELIKLATERTNFRFISESRRIDPTIKSGVISTIILNLFMPRKMLTVDDLQFSLDNIVENYRSVANSYGLELAEAFESYESTVIDEEDIEDILRIKNTLLDKLLIEAVVDLKTIDSRTPIEKNLIIKQYLELIQPLPINYGYARGIVKDADFITYQDIGTVQVNRGIGNTIISDVQSFVITVQTKTALNNMAISEIIKLGTQGTDIYFLTESLRRDTAVKVGYINTIIVNVFNDVEAIKVVYTAKEVRGILQAIADRYIFITSIYYETLKKSFIDKLIVPELEDKLYTYDEMLALKQEYLDRLILTVVKF